MTEGVSHKWEPITDLPPNWEKLRPSNLKHLAEIWLEQKQRLNKTNLEEFMTRLKREWAIETGMIENLYKLDRGLTQTLIEQGIEVLDSLHEPNVQEPGFTKALILDQQEVIEGLFSFIKGERPLSTSYIKEIHQTLTRNQEYTDAINHLGQRQKVKLEKGVWKTLPNNPTQADGLVHEYCPPEQVASEMDKLLLWHHEHERKKVAPEIEAAWLHHRFVQIHPFQDGNGRVARALATIILIKADWFPLIVSYSDRNQYLTALEEADRKNLKTLVDFFAASEQKSFLAAMKISANLLDKKKTINSAIVAIGKKLQSLREQQSQEHSRVWSIAALFQEVISKKLDDLVRQLSGMFMNNQLELSIFSDSSTAHNYGYDWFRGQIIKGAKEYDYYANLRESNVWYRLKIQSGPDVPSEKTTFSIIVSVHPVGREFTGVLAVTAFSEYREPSDEGSTVSEPSFINNRPFIFTYKDTNKQTQEEFENWLNETLAIALTDWQARL
ncbi:MAG: Fic family protein [Candidatus Adiutrix sp.]|jgi:Fic family protein|nr:Fic family protein [Candidatus Adiutrix sp.]